MTYYVVSVYPKFGLCDNPIIDENIKPKWNKLAAIMWFFPDYYKNIREARYAAGKFAVAIDKAAVRVFVETHCSNGHRRIEEVTEFEAGIL